MKAFKDCLASGRERLSDIELIISAKKKKKILKKYKFQVVIITFNLLKLKNQTYN